MDKKPQCAGEHIAQMVQELYIHYHGFVTHNECTIITHKAHNVHNLID